MNSPNAHAKAMAKEMYRQWIECTDGMPSNCIEIISTALEKLLTENERLKFQWEHETCNHCGYMRSPVAPCKCGQLVTVGTNNFLRNQLTATEAKLKEEYPCKCGATIKVLRPKFCSSCLDKEFANIHKYFSTLTAAKKEEAK